MEYLVERLVKPVSFSTLFRTCPKNTAGVATQTYVNTAGETGCMYVVHWNTYWYLMVPTRQKDNDKYSFKETENDLQLHHQAKSSSTPSSGQRCR